MINKILKRINNKFSTLFKFLFFLRYLFGIFFIFGATLLLIPHYFDQKKRNSAIGNYLLDDHNLELKTYEKITYNSFPVPSFEIKNADLELDIDDRSLFIQVETLKIFPKLINFYDYNNFKINKIIFDKNKISLDESKLNLLLKFFYNLEKKLNILDLDLKLKNKNTSLIDLKKINFSNYGYKKNIVRGELFDKKFKITFNDKYNKLNFSLLKTGIDIDIFFDEINKDSLFSGVVKSKLLNSNLKFNFKYDDKNLNIYNSYFRSKYLSFSNESVITHRPFFNIRSVFEIDNIEANQLKNININTFLKYKKLIRNFNTKSKISFKSEKLISKLIDEFYLTIDLVYGRLTYSNEILISGNFFKCKGSINLLEEYPILYFNCKISSNDKKQLLKEFSIRYRNSSEPLEVNAKGNINILNNKINFNNISMKNYEASKEDLNYFKQSFQNIVFNKGFVNIFDLKKIKEFILDIS